MVKLLLLILLAPIACFAGSASIHVRGHLICNGQPYKNEVVQVWEHNNLLADTQMADVKTDASGYFTIEASVQESWMFTPSPYIYVPNYCGSVVVGKQQCTESVIRIDVPEAFIAEGNLPDQIFDIGSLELWKVDQTDRHGLGKMWFSEKVCRIY